MTDLAPNTIDEIITPNTVWSSDWDCAKNDLGCFLTEESKSLATEDWRVIMFHTGKFVCSPGVRWYKKV